MERNLIMRLERRQMQDFVKKGDKAVHTFHEGLCRKDGTFMTKRMDLITRRVCAAVSMQAKIDGTWNRQARKAICQTQWNLTNQEPLP